MQFWNELEGRLIDGVYPLRRLVRSEGRHAWFETEVSEPQAGPATISLTEALTDADEIIERLQAAQELKHPNLVAITKVGQTRVDTTLVIYAVMEHIEQSLSDVLQSQALSPEEGREVAEALVGALTAIHQQGMSHGRVEASSVLATEDTVKLRSDCLHLTTAGQADDVAAIGTTLFHAFTQRKAVTATDAQINRIPAPFAEIIRNAFARRWTLPQISNALKPVLPVASTIPQAASPVAAAAVAVPRVAPAPVAAPPVAPPRPTPPPAADAAVARPVPPAATPTPSAPVATAATPAAFEPSPRTLRRDEDDEEEETTQKPWLLYGAVAVVLLLILGWFFLRPRSAAAPGEAPAPPARASAPAAASPPPASAKPSAARTVPLAAKPAPAVRVHSATATPAAATDGRTIWRVVVYTYRGQTKASDMATQIGQKHPDLGAEVFNPPGRSGVYLVTLGGAMDHQAAMKLRDQAQHEGLPPDTYVQNFSR